MKATMKDLDGLRVAAWLAGQGVSGLLRFARRGDDMEVIGTDSYVLLRVLAECDYEDWPEGESVQIVGTVEAKAVRKVVGSPSFGDLRPLTVSVTEAGGAQKVEFSRRDEDAVLRSFSCVDDSRRVDYEALVSGVEKGESEGHVSSYLWGTVGQVVSKLPCVEWELRDHGPKNPFELTSVCGRILAQPSARGGR